MRKNSALRRVAAWLTSLALLAAQLALPALALAQDLTDMPEVTVFYQTAEEGPQQSMMATPTSDPSGRAYWATLPAEAFGWPITMAVFPQQGSP